MEWEHVDVCCGCAQLLGDVVDFAGAGREHERVGLRVGRERFAVGGERGGYDVVEEAGFDTARPDPVASVWRVGDGERVECGRGTDVRDGFHTFKISATA